jgi:hypothetical protein
LVIFCQLILSCNVKWVYGVKILYIARNRSLRLPVVIVDEKTHILRIILQIPDKSASLLGNPGHVGVGRAACQMNASSSQLEGQRGQADAKPDRVAGAHKTASPGAQPGKDKQHQLNIILAASGLEVNDDSN